MIKVKVSIPKDLFDELRTLPSRSRRRLNDDIKTNIQPEAQKHALDLLGTDPGPVKYPFEFGTKKSRAAYFATNGFGQGIPYKRKDVIRRAWKVEITRQGENSYMTVFNSNEKAKYVYGNLPEQRQIPGHAATGWGRDQKTAIDLLEEFLFDEVTNAWYRAVTDVLKS